MTRLLVIVAVGFMLIGAGRSAQAPYAVSGTVRDTNRQGVGAARIEVDAPGFEGTFTVSGRDGRYRIADLAGGVQLKASKDGYFADSLGLASTRDAIVDFTLQPLERFSIGARVKGSLTRDHPICAGKDSGDGGPCYRFLVTAPVAGLLEVVLTWNRSIRPGLSLAVVAPDGLSVRGLQGADLSKAHVAMTVRSGATYEVRALGERDTPVHTFELTSALK
jgi:hypothetical protein